MPIGFNGGRQTCILGACWPLFGRFVSDFRTRKLGGGTPAGSDAAASAVLTLTSALRGKSKSLLGEPLA